jgi:hypothetical protein
VERSLLLAATQFTRLHLAVLCLVNHLHRSVIWLLLAVVAAILVALALVVLELERYP